ncbi:uncharacterized protein LOC133837707 isoform X1 [Drosophila sulfurigaster albostrigata]|uniref:uncharacterized protein LOC133837707 isoform X1 n=1 Tax=Drosophila sulfurigaster albostrigata TaxID=89887 RepID=UPI002D21B676|nr:uncharacterized protein LOC133837707 isoform X1 [Drosophila sulfurigaster albostrigata]
MRVLLMLAACLSLVVQLEGSALLSGEERSIRKCLNNYGGLNAANAERLDRYTQWSESNEEVPCFTQCYLREMFDFYHEEAGFDAIRIKKHFGEAVYEACSERLKLGDLRQSSCEHAYAGFHCIVSLENDPFILIENMQNATRAAKSAMKECLQQVDQVEWNRISDYARFPVTEPIPCFTRCFISRLELFDERTHRWRVPAMRRVLGVPALGAHVAGCAQRRGRNPCATMYQQFTCFVLAV